MKILSALMSMIATPLSALNTETLFLGHLKRASQTISEMSNLPSVSIDLMMSEALENHQFYRDVTREYHLNATRRHARFPLVRQLEYGVAISWLRSSPRPYVERVGATAKRNVKKAWRLGYRFARIDYNHHLDDITAIHRSSKTRQGRAMPQQFFAAPAPAIVNPPSTNPTHDYAYFGIFKGDTLVAYASCLIAGELCAIETIYGHVDHQSEGVIPLLLVSMADDVIQHHPQVLFYIYDTYFGASETMQRFKRKFLFLPHRVKWRGVN